MEWNLNNSSFVFIYRIIEIVLRALTTYCTNSWNWSFLKKFSWLQMPSTCVWPAARWIKVWGGLRSSSILFLTVITCPSVGARTHTLNTASLLPPTSAAHGQRHRPHAKAIAVQQEVLIGWGPLHVRSPLVSNRMKAMKDVWMLKSQSQIYMILLGY